MLHSTTADTARSKELIADHFITIQCTCMEHQLLDAVNFGLTFAPAVGTIVEPRSSASTHSVHSADSWQETSDFK